MRAAQDAIDGRTKNYVFEHRMLHKDGSIRWFMVRGEVIRDQLQKPVRFVGTDTDITERRRLEQNTRELSNKIRTRIGHDLHDGLGQELTGISLMLTRLETQLKEDGSPHADRAREVRELAKSAISTTRALARGLSPVVRASGLARSLGQLAANTRKLYRVNCLVELPSGLADRYSDVAVNELYCIVQEAVTNAIMHGKASLIEVEGRLVGKRFLLNIADNGNGFRGPNLESASMGLRIMQYRARDLGGSLTITRRRGVGTLVVCSCPIPGA
jgi:signal transduction histidine kinase